VGPRQSTRSRRRRRLELAWHGVNRGRPPTGYGREGVPDVRSLVEDPYASVDESDRRLDELLEAFEARDDRRSMFLTVYSRVTEAVGKRIDRGGFEEPDWVADYLVTFANLYREAVHDFEAGNLNALADPWQLAFEAAEQEGYHALQHVALDINAHINYDLALALDEVGIERNRGRKRADHAAVNEVLGRLVDGNQDRLAEKYDPSIAAIDESLGDLDDLFSILTIDKCRGSAWRTAVALSSPLAVRRRFAMWVTRVTSTGGAYLVLSTPVPR